MKGTTRRLIVLTLPFLPAFFAVVMAVRSFAWTDSLLWSSPHVATSAGITASGRYAISTEGMIIIGVERATWTPPTLPAFNHTATSGVGWSLTSEDHPWDVIIHGFWGDRYLDVQPGYANYERFVRIPWLAVFVLLIPIAAPTVFHFVRARRRRIRAMNQQCVNCGYDIRATPDRCPECGTRSLR